MAASQSVSESADPTRLGAESASECFHCGSPLPGGADYPVVIDGRGRPMCCPGCQAVARAIVEAELTDFYRYRTAPSQRTEDLVPEPLRSLALYDQPELQQSFVHREDENVREAALIVEGIVCAACLWLTERHVCALPGVLEFRVNYTTHRARVRWDQREIRLSTILGATAAIGYPAHPFDPGRQEALHKQERSLALRRVAVAGLGAMQVMMLAVAMYFGDYYGMDDDIRHFMRWISLLIATPVLLYAARPFFSAAWRDLRRGGLGMDVPVALAIAGAFSASAWHTWQGSGAVYFDSATMFTFFLLTGRFLEMSARHRAGQISEELARLLPATATRLNANDAEESVSAAELKPGDRVLIRPGETIAADGRVQTGSSSVDESLLSGESNPIVKTPGETLMGGAVNVESPLVMVVEKVGADTLLSSIVRLLDRAQAEKPGIAMLADRVASVFVAAVLLIATGVAWWWWRHDPDAAFTVTLSVLVVTCPCALSLATPTAITVATSCLTRLGLLTTRGHALETLARATHVVFDKTGTLTYGRLRLLAIHPVRDDSPLPVLELAAALERGSEHPVGRALAEAASGSLRADALQNTPGRGTQGLIQGIPYRVGSGEFVAALSGTPPVVDPRTSPATRVALGDEKGLLAWFEFADQLRPDAAQTVRALKALGLEVLLLSGDRPETVATVARQIALPQAEGGLLPRDKLDRVENLQSRGAVVAMVGDGVNDAPVLARSQVSIAMGEGTQLAHASADMVLLSEQLSRFVDGVHIARRALAVIRQNLAWAIAYNVIALPLAAAGWVAPWMAALGMSLSSLLVVANALRLKQDPPTPGAP